MRTRDRSKDRSKAVVSRTVAKEPKKLDAVCTKNPSDNRCDRTNFYSTLPKDIDVIASYARHSQLGSNSQDIFETQHNDNLNSASFTTKMLLER